MTDHTPLTPDERLREHYRRAYERTQPLTHTPLTDEELAAIEARDAWLRNESNWWRCADCEWCSACKRLAACEEHDDSDDVPHIIADLRASRAEVERLRDMLFKVDTGDPSVNL